MLELMLELMLKGVEISQENKIEEYEFLSFGLMPFLSFLPVLVDDKTLFFQMVLKVTTKRTKQKTNRLYC